MQPGETPASNSSSVSARSLCRIAEHVAQLPLDRAIEALTRHVADCPFLEGPAFELCLRALYVAAALDGEPKSGVPSPTKPVNVEIHRTLMDLEKAEGVLGSQLRFLLTKNLLRRLPGKDVSL